VPEFVRFKVGDELKLKQLELLEKSRKTGKVKAGVNEVTKAVERGIAKLVLIAEDVNPAEIVMHLPLLCEEKKIPYSFVSSKKELGEKAGIQVSTSAAVIIDDNGVKKELSELIKKLNELKK
jgi:large subunit ribosomal protein L7Ae